MDEELATLLLTMASQRQLMAWLTASERGEEERSRAIDCLAQLHCGRRIDLFEHIGRPPGDDEWHLDYGLWSRAYRDLVPLLDDEAVKVVSGIVGLATGIWEPVFHEAFLDWCTRNEKRIDAVLELESRPEIPDFCFAAALIAGLRTNPNVYIDAAVEYAQGNRRSRMPGIRAIGAMSLQEDTAVCRAVSVLESIVKDGRAPAQDRADALTAAVEIAQRCGAPLDGPVCGIVATATAERQPELLHACCHVLVRYGTQLRNSLLPYLLDALLCLDISIHAVSTAGAWIEPQPPVSSRL